MSSSLPNVGCRAKDLCGWLGRWYVCTLLVQLSISAGNECNVQWYNQLKPPISYHFWESKDRIAHTLHRAGLWQWLVQCEWTRKHCLSQLNDSCRQCYSKHLELPTTTAKGSIVFNVSICLYVNVYAFIRFYFSVSFVKCSQSNFYSATLL